MKSKKPSSPQKNLPLLLTGEGMRQAFKLGLVFLIVIIIFLGYSIFFRPLINNKQVNNNQNLYFILTPGTSASSFVENLYNNNLIYYPKIILLLIKLRGDSEYLHAGEYFISPNMSIWELLNHVAMGKVALHKLKIIEGWDFQQVLFALNNNPYLNHELLSLNNAAIMQKIGHPRELPEGKFFPSTYLFSLGTPDIKILKQAYDTMNQLLLREWANRDSKFYSNPYQALITASLIEKEASHTDERKKIAGVIIRRLEKKMPLQIDATVIYGLGNRPAQGQLSQEDLKIPSVFNTYRHHYLPPTPIAMPSLDAIRAALHPIMGDVLYYVAKGNGEHYFSRDLNEHHRAIYFYRGNQ